MQRDLDPSSMFAAAEEVMIQHTTDHLETFTFPLVCPPLGRPGDTCGGEVCRAPGQAAWLAQETQQ